jgi:hypothetical protein
VLGVGALAALVLPGKAAPVLGFTAIEDCSGVIDNNAAGNDGELYLTKVTSSAANPLNDMLFDLREKGEAPSNAGTTLAANDWSADEAWRIAQAGSDVHFAFVTYAPVCPTCPGRIYLDSGNSVDFVFGAAAVQEVGNSMPAGQDASIGIQIPGSRATYSVDLGPAPATFPKGTTTSGINIAFAPLVDVGSFEPAGAGTGCTVGGALADPLDPNTTNPTPTRGGIIGYNVYRIPDTGANSGTAAEFTASLSDADPSSGWQYFLDVRSFRLTVADNTVLPGPGGTAGSDLTPSDLTGLQNPDARMYSGDEAIIYQDSPANMGTPRSTGTAPTLSQSYWYAVQPVIVGSVNFMGGPQVPAGPDVPVGFTNNTFFTGDHRMDLDGDTQMDAVSLDSVVPHPGAQTPEFISPQAEAGIAGLGLTHGGRLLLSAPIHYNGDRATNPLPATGGGTVSLSGTLQGSNINLQFTTGIEAGRVLGYNVYRGTGEQRVRVNEQPILAQGNESNAYQLVDDVKQAQRLARGGTIPYSVEIVYSDGTPTQMVGPFDVAVERQQVPGRRQR